MSAARTNISFYARFFGKFELHGGKQVLSQSDLASPQLTKLLAYLVDHAGDGCTSQELIDMLWTEELRNPANALRNLVYRLRRELDRVWPDREFLVGGHGIYQWNPSYPLRTDTQEFEEASTRYRDVDRADTEARTALAEQIRALYTQRYLSDFSDDHAVVFRQTYYHNRYQTIMREACELYLRANAYEPLTRLCEHVLLIDPHDEQIHCYLLQAYIGQNRFELAEKHYRDVAQLLRSELGQEPSDEMRRIYDRMMAQRHDREMNLAEIKKEMAEGRLMPGAFYCEYGVFQRIFQLEMRQKDRLDIPITIALISLYEDDRRLKSLPNGAVTDVVSRIPRAMNYLQEILMRTLRYGDAFTRYSDSQFLVMLSNCPVADAETVVMRRISGAFYRERGIGRVQMQYSLDLLS